MLEETAHSAFDEADAALDAAHGNLQVVHLAVIVGRCQVVSTEGAQKESQEQVQNLGGRRRVNRKNVTEVLKHIQTSKDQTDLGLVSNTLLHHFIIY